MWLPEQMPSISKASIQIAPPNRNARPNTNNTTANERMRHEACVLGPGSANKQATDTATVFIFKISKKSGPPTSISHPPRSPPFGSTRVSGRLCLEVPHPAPRGSTPHQQRWRCVVYRSGVCPQACVRWLRRNLYESLNWQRITHPYRKHTQLHGDELHDPVLGCHRPRTKAS